MSNKTVEYFIGVSNDYLITGFSSREEATSYLKTKENEDYLKTLNEQAGGDESTLKVLSRRQVSSIVLDVFWSESGSFNPIWINGKKHKNIASYFE